MDSTYYSDYDVTGKYNPEPLVDEVFTPRPGELKRFNIDNPDLLNRIIDATNPADSIFGYNSKFQRNFNGLYITTEAVEEGGAYAKLQLANPLAGMRFNYYHDSVSVAARDTVPISTYYIRFDHRFAQKINLFHHDFTGTALENIIDNEDAILPIAYAQGMAGVNVKIRVPDLRDTLGSGQIAINAARLVFDIVPDSLSGIASEDYPQQLMMESQLPDGTPAPLYDQVINTDAFNLAGLPSPMKTVPFWKRDITTVLVLGAIFSRYFQVKLRITTCSYLLIIRLPQTKLLNSGATIRTRKEVLDWNLFIQNLIRSCVELLVILEIEMLIPFFLKG